jgi:ABC-type multidrug transport system fused ATPase/permease subunit
MTADHIVVVCSGEVVERGTHHDLVARRGLYTRLVNSGAELMVA